MGLQGRLAQTVARAAAVCRCGCGTDLGEADRGQKLCAAGMLSSLLCRSLLLHDGGGACGLLQAGTQTIS